MSSGESAASPAAGGRGLQAGSIALLIAASVLLPLGLFIPTIFIETLDPLTRWVGSGFAEYRPNNDALSICGVIRELWLEGSRGLSAIVFAFSVVFPTTKLLVLWVGALCMRGGELKAGLRRALWLSDNLGRWSLLDVLLVAVVLVTLKQFPGGVQVTLGSGIWFFGGSIVLTMVAGMLLHRWHSKRAG